MPGELQYPPTTGDETWFQSAPGIDAGRIDWNGAGNRDAEFQSAPGIDAGRIIKSAGTVWPLSVFQSAPGIDAGRIAARLGR